MVSIRPEKPICAPPRLPEVSPTLPLKPFQCCLIDDGPLSSLQGGSSIDNYSLGKFFQFWEEILTFIDLWRCKLVTGFERPISRTQLPQDERPQRCLRWFQFHRLSRHEQTSPWAHNYSIHWLVWIGLNKVDSFIVITNSTNNRYGKLKSNMLLFVLPKCVKSTGHSSPQKW